jgi:hypothetical protein
MASIKSMSSGFTTGLALALISWSCNAAQPTASGTALAAGTKAPAAGTSSLPNAGAAGAPSMSNDAGSPPTPPRDAGAVSGPSSDAGSVSNVVDDADAGDSATPPTAAMGSPAKGWEFSAPRKVGLLVGRDADYAQKGLQVYGTDMGPSFAHGDQIFMLFGDTYAATDSACDISTPHNDDLMGTLPFDYEPGLPRFEAIVEPSAPTQYRKVQLNRDGQSIVLDAFKVPVAGFSDGKDAYAFFQSQAPVRCDSAAAACPAQMGVTCTPDIVICAPAPVTAPVTCENPLPVCLPGRCPDTTSVCVDTHSSQYDGSTRGNAASVLSVVDIAKSRPDDVAVFDSVATWQTNSFSHPSIRTVTTFTGKRAGNDYSVGYGTLLIWGRNGMVAEQGREDRPFFATQALPLEKAGGFHPQYYAGIDPSGEPRWSSDAAQAKPLALDGVAGGNPHEELAFVGTESVSWLGAPINRWVMMYGGDVGDFMLADPQGTRSTPNSGAVVVRFAEHPWGPWSTERPHLTPGSPAKVGDMYGPGGIMFHPDCKDQGGERCAPYDPYTLSPIGLCQMNITTEPGRLYSPNIIDRYTRANARGGLDISWVVSTWNPYTVVLFESSIDPK